MRKLQLLVFVVVCAACIEGVDVSQLYPTAAYQCLRNTDLKYAIIRSLQPDGTLQPDVVNNLNNARAASMATDIYLSPCRGKSPQTQVDQIMSTVSANLYAMVWVSVQANTTPGCEWSSDYNANCHFIKELVARVKFYDKNPGIYTSQALWQKIMGSSKACPQLASQSLWYIQLDNKASFTGFKSFGGWTNPNMKQFQTKQSLCGSQSNVNFYHFY